MLLNLKMCLSKSEFLLYNVATLKIAASGTSRRWRLDILEHRGVGSNIATLEILTLGNGATLARTSRRCPVFMNRNVHILTSENLKNPNYALRFLQVPPANLHPSSSQLTLALSKALRTFLSPKTLRSTLIWIHSTRSSFRVT